MRASAMQFTPELMQCCYVCRIWFSYINPIYWTVYGLIISQVDNLDTLCVLANGQAQPVYEAVLTIFGYQ